MKIDFNEVRELLQENHTTISNPKQFLANVGATGISKAKVSLGKRFKYVYPLQLRTPFNPLNLEDKNYNRENEFVAPLAPSTIIRAIKDACRKSEELRDKYCKKFGVDWDVSEDAVTTADKKIWQKYLVPIQYDLMVQKFAYSSFGKFGRAALSSVVKNEYNEVIKGDLGYQLFLLETAHISRKVDALKATFETGGENAHLTNEEKEKKVSEVWASRRVKSPKRKGVLVHLEIPIAGTGVNIKVTASENDDTMDVQDPETFFPFHKYSDGSEAQLKKLIRRISEFDLNSMDYIEADVYYPNITGQGKKEEERKLESYQGREFELKTDAPISTILEGFDSAFALYRREKKFFEDALVLRSVREFRPIHDDVLLESAAIDLRNRLNEIDIKVLEAHKELVAKIDQSLLLDKLEQSGLDAEEGKEIDLDELTKFAQEESKEFADEMNIDTMDIEEVIAAETIEV